MRQEDPELDPQDALDEASDFVAGRVRRLCQLGVAEVVVLERSGEAVAATGAAAEAHTAIARLGRHFGVPVTLVALDDAVPAGRSRVRALGVAGRAPAVWCWCPRRRCETARPGRSTGWSAW